MEPSTQTSNFDDPVVAQQAANLTKAIFQHESSTNYDAVGDAGTSHGAGQWQSGTWKAQAQDVLGDADAPMTQANQSIVAQGTIRKLISQGKNAAQIAAIWNSGNDSDWQNKVGTTTINGKQIAYNVPQYVKSVTDLYQQYKGQGAPQGTDNSLIAPPAPAAPYTAPSGAPAPTSQDNPSIGDQLTNRLGQAGTALNQAATGKINPLSGILQTAGAVGGFVGDAANDALELIPGVKQGEDLLSKGVGALANTGVGKSVVGAGENFAQAHPELAGDIGAVGNIAGAIGTFAGAGALKDAAGSAIGRAIGKDALSSVAADVAPDVSGKAAASAAAKGGVQKGGLFGGISSAPSSGDREVAQAVVDNVPGFQKMNTFTDKLNATRDAVYNMADNLKQQIIQSGKDIIYPFKELNSAMENVDIPIAIKSDPVLNRQFDLARQAALQIAQEKGGTISSLFDARKEFDQLVAKQFPNLYDRTNAPMRDAITGIRGAMNDFIESHLPEGSGFKESLQQQSRLFKAIDNMSSKSVKEIGSNNFTRFAKRHPKVTGAIKHGAGAVGAGLGIGEAQNLFGNK